VVAPVPHEVAGQRAHGVAADTTPVHQGVEEDIDRGMPVRGFLLFAVLHHSAHRPVQQDGEAPGRLPLDRDLGPGRVRDDVAVVGDPRQLLVVQVGEEEQLAQLGRGQPLRRGGHEPSSPALVDPMPRGAVFPDDVASSVISPPGTGARG